MRNKNGLGQKYMNDVNKNNPLHGVTLQRIVISLVGFYGWDGLADRIRVRCFQNDPSVKSSLKFLRKTPWARKKVEDLYIYTENLRELNPKEEEIEDEQENIRIEDE